MATSEPPTIDQVRALQTQAQDAATRRAQAEALQTQSTAQLSELLAKHGVATVEELEAKAAAAGEHAAQLFAQAQAALA